MAAITLEQLKDVVVHLSDKEFEELVEAREQAWDRQIEADAEAGKFSIFHFSLESLKERTRPKRFS